MELETEKLAREIVHHYSFNDYLHWGTHISHVWFSWWRVDRLLPFILTLGVMFMLSMVHESLSMVRRRMLVHAMTTTHSRSGSVGIASLVRLLEAGLSGLLILGLMTFNGWIFLSICLGSGIGYYVTLSMDDGSAVGYSPLEPALHH